MKIASGLLLALVVTLVLAYATRGNYARARQKALERGPSAVILNPVYGFSPEQPFLKEAITARCGVPVALYDPYLAASYVTYDGTAGHGTLTIARDRHVLFKATGQFDSLVPGLCATIRLR